MEGSAIYSSFRENVAFQGHRRMVDRHTAKVSKIKAGRKVSDRLESGARQAHPDSEQRIGLLCCGSCDRALIVSAVSARSSMWLQAWASNVSRIRQS